MAFGAQFAHLFSPIEIGGCTIENRIVSTGHDTNMVEDNRPSDAMIAYHRARARGGAGLIIIQVTGVHETACLSDHMLMAQTDACIPHYSALFEAIQEHGTKVFVQLFHPGREILGRPEGVVPVTFAPSASPSERFQTVPRALTLDTIAEIIDGYGQTARRIVEAGADGVEIVASQGYLPAQFISPHVNHRTDEYGVTEEARLRFSHEIIEACRRNVDDAVVGMRLSMGERDLAGLSEDESLAVCRSLGPELDYLSLVAGSSATAAAASHIVPSMAWENAYLSTSARTVKQATGKTTMLTGRINQPHEAEQLIAEGVADLCGMTRAMICDPEMPNKAMARRSDDIRACIGCNQACINHYQLGLPISCIQYPESGRELTFGSPSQSAIRRSVIVAGGGVAGMKAAVVASKRGHSVHLIERGSNLGGQALLAQLLPGRAEFGGIVTNLLRELELSDVTISKNTTVTREMIASERPDAVIVATGSIPASPLIEADEGCTIVQAVDVLSGQAKVGNQAVVYDWRGDWVGIGIAEHLARDGVRVRLAVNGPCAGGALQSYLRDEAAARLYRLGVDVMPYLRLYGADADTAYFVHTAAQDAVVVEDIDTIVLAYPNQSQDTLADVARGVVEHVQIIGDALTPRTAEEAVYEGLKAGWAI